MTGFDADIEYRKDHAESAKYAIDISVTNYLKLLRVPNDGCAKCVEDVRAVLRNYEPS
jgi:hypothetical protein